MIDFGLHNDIAVINDTFQEAIQEIDILFSTHNTELLGDVNYGTNFEQFLWEMVPSESQLEAYIENKINSCTLFAALYKHTIQVESLQDTSENIYVVHFSIYDTNGKEINKNYIIK